MIPEINAADFEFTYLHDYARYLCEQHLDEFVLVGIRFSREANLPILKPLSKFPEAELVKLGRDSNKELLLALAEKRFAEHVEAKSRQWIDNTLGILDKDDIMVEDLTMGFYLRRKIFAHFLDIYTKNMVLQKFIIAEVDRWTTREELIFYTIYLRMQQEKLLHTNADLEFHKQLLLDAQELGGMGSFIIHLKDRSKSYFSPEYKKIFGLDDVTSLENFYDWVHPEDRAELMEKVNHVYAHGGSYEVSYRYVKSQPEKRIWSRGFVLIENGKATFLRGVAREVE